MIGAARAERPTAWFDAGSTLYLDIPVPADRVVQAELTADALAELLPRIGLAAAGLGPHDLPRPRFPRQAANAPAGSLVEPPKLVDVGGVKVGVFGVVSPGAVPGATDPATAARTAIAALRGRGADVVVALAGMTRAEARRLARDAPGADLIVIGKELPDKGTPVFDSVGASTLVAPVDRGQVLVRADLHVDRDAKGPFVDAIGPERAQAELARLDERIAGLAADLARWEKDATAEKSFVDKNRADLAGLKQGRDALAAQPLRAPAHGNWLILRAVPIKKGLACDKEIVAQKTALDTAIGQANVKAAASEVPRAPAPGQAAFAGVEECGYCHKPAVEFWSTTRHAGAFGTLVAVGKQWNRDCIGCHVTGWQEPGGATLVANELLRDVQCESCHGPASIHVDKNGHDKPRTVARAPAADLCATRCHTPEHSDTFQLEAYLRDVTGPGHGEARRTKLGAGPTGHALRQAALTKAGAGIGAGCPK